MSSETSFAQALEKGGIHVRSGPVEELDSRLRVGLPGDLKEEDPDGEGRCAQYGQGQVGPHFGAPRHGGSGAGTEGPFRSQTARNRPSGSGGSAPTCVGKVSGADTGMRHLLCVRTLRWQRE